MTPESEETTYTSAEEWPTDDGAEDLTLPSGAKVRVAPPPVFWLGVTGRIPAHLQAIAKKHQADGKDWAPAENQQVVEWLISESFIEPKVSLGKKPGCLLIAKLSDRDKEAVVMELRLPAYVGALK
jgi:hypothetical protein